MKIGELATRAGIAASAIRYYEQAGLMPKAERGFNGYREYGESALERINLIQIGQKLGFTLEAMRTMLALEGDKLHAGLMQNLDARLADIDRLMATLSQQRDSLLETRQQVRERHERGECPSRL